MLDEVVASTPTQSPATGGIDTSTWLPVVTLVVGLVLGFLSDMLRERSRRKREDRLRFIDEKRRAYADMAMACHDVQRLLEQIDEWDEQRGEVEGKLAQLVGEHGEDVPEDVPGYSDLVDEMREVLTERERIETRVHALGRAVTHGNVILSLLAPVDVQVAGAAIVNLLSDEDVPSEDQFNDTFWHFLEIARDDLGTPPVD